MRIGYVTSHINKSLQWNWFSEELLKRGIAHTHIVINDYEPILKKDMEALGVPVHYLHHKGPATHMSNLVTTRKLLRDFNPDIVHTELPHGNLIGQMAARWGGFRNRVATCENATWAEDHGSSKHAFIDKLAYRSAKRVISLTDLSRDYLHKYYKLPMEKITTIGHAVKVEDYISVDPGRVQKLATEFGVKDNDIILGMVARLEEWKGHRYVIEALAALKDKYPTLRLMIFGSEGPDKDALFTLTEQLGLTDRVSYHGFISDPVAMYQLFDIHVHVPVSEMAETFGITVIEGMVSGCAQILTRSGVSYFSARDNENALVVPHKNSDSVAEAIDKLISTPELGARLAEQAVNDAHAEYSFKVKVDKHMDIYESLL